LFANALDPANLAFDKSGNLIVTSMSGNGTVLIPLSLPRRIRDYFTQATACTAAIWCLCRIYRSAIAHQQVPALTKPASHFVSPDETAFLRWGRIFWTER